ncbi:hypothetical protein EGN72_00270, partial [Pseudorhodobacter sp. E13]|uniref:hypothetical protein n=1 Tax=Pseudorhodobacter sp. E13 TaxID=2487931 RepID=UPI000FAA31B6
AATATGATVVLTYSVPYGTLALDSANVRSYPQSGFRFIDSTGEKAISNVVVSAPNQVTLTLASASTGIGKTVYYGTTPHLEPRQASTVPGGNLRDSSGEIWKSTLDGQRLDCWAEHQAFTI